MSGNYKLGKTEYMRQWHAAHPNYKKEKWASLTEEQKTKYRAQKMDHYYANHEKRRAAVRKVTQDWITKVFDAYGNKCACCGETLRKFLTIDHIHGRSPKEKRHSGTELYRSIAELGYPKDKFQLLCWNCNAAKGIRGGCPHQTTEGEYGISSC